MAILPFRSLGCLLLSWLARHELQVRKVLLKASRVEGHQSVGLEQSMCADDEVCQQALGSTVAGPVATAGVSRKSSPSLNPYLLAEQKIDSDARVFEEAIQQGLADVWVGKEFAIHRGSEQQRSVASCDAELLGNRLSSWLV
jgi:hypothetical protein